MIRKTGATIANPTAAALRHFFLPGVLPAVGEGIAAPGGCHECTGGRFGRVAIMVGPQASRLLDVATHGRDNAFEDARNCGSLDSIRQPGDLAEHETHGFAP